ncbi:hypothetical protein ACUXST_000423 [Sphingomonas sp. F9_3S_D5_B_2]
MRLADARIGYAGYSRDFSVPGDRRRFAAYARMRGLDLEYAELSKQYDLVIGTYSSDLTGWITRKRREGDRFKFVFELIDSYFEQTGRLRRLLKGSARYALGTDSRLTADFLKTLVNACEAADAVICSTEEQRETIGRYNPNVFISFDDFGDELGAPKSNYRKSARLKLVWEGQSTTLPNLQAIRGPLNDLRERIELNVITDPVISRWFGRFGSYPSIDALRVIECQKVFHQWRKDSFATLIKACDAAVIPIDRSNRLWWGKPENKLVLLWKLGMPVLTSATPVYERAMGAAGLDMSCATEAEWGAALERLLSGAPSEMEAIGRKGREYAERAYSRDEFTARLDAAFEAAGFSTGRLRYSLS